MGFTRRTAKRVVIVVAALFVTVSTVARAEPPAKCVRTPFQVAGHAEVHFDAVAVPVSGTVSVALPAAPTEIEQITVNFQSGAPGISLFQITYFGRVTVQLFGQ